MKIKKLFILSITALLIGSSGCQNFDELTPNPNIAGENAIVPPSYLLGRILYELYQGGGEKNDYIDIEADDAEIGRLIAQGYIVEEY